MVMIINVSPVVTLREGTYRLTVGCDGGSPSPFDTRDTFTLLFFLHSFPSIIYYFSSLFFCRFPFFVFIFRLSFKPAFLHLLPHNPERKA